eukprot:5336762-Prorocentrum_lima.AAC.1
MRDCLLYQIFKQVAVDFLALLNLSHKMRNMTYLKLKGGFASTLETMQSRMKYVQEEGGY